MGRGPRAAPRATVPATSLRALVLILLAFAGCRNRQDAVQTTSASQYAAAVSAFRAERYAEALAKTAQGLQRAPSSSDWYWKFRLLNAQVYLGKRDALHARAALEFELPPNFRTAPNLGRLLLCQGFAAGLLQDFATARARLDAAAVQARTAAAGELLAEIQNRQGLVAVSQGRFADAGDSFQQALQYAAAHTVPWLEISAIGNLGFRLMRQGLFEAAIPYFEKSVSLARRFGAVESEARNTGNLGWCYYRIGDLDKATLSFSQAESLFEKTGNRSEQEIWLGNIGNIQLGRLEYPAAAVSYKRALELARSLGAQGQADAASWLSNLARISLETGDPNAAELYNDQALKIKRELNLKTAEVYSTLNAAKIASDRGKFRESEAIVREILRSSYDDPTPRLRAHEQLAIVLASTGRYGLAEAEFRAAIAELERGRKQLLKAEYKLAWLSSLIGFYQDFIDFLMERGKTTEALEVADSSHAATMLERLRLTRKPPAGSHRGTDFQKLAQVSGSTLLSYSLGVRKSYLWIVTPAAIRAIVLPPASVLRPLIAAWDKSIQDLSDPLAEPIAAGHQLYNALIVPALPFIGNAHRVILVPDGLLYSLNFETLPVPGPRPHYWIEDATISIAPSLGLLNAENRVGAAFKDSLLLIGNPVSPGPEFPALASAAQEMSSIEKSFPLARKVVLSQSAARPGAWTQVSPGDFDLIHFTAHATASREEPLESAVILSRDGGGYKLHARDVILTPLNARLVTISACRGAGSRIYSGEGLVGLAWAFLEAGAHNVIAGLWDVSDESGAKTMARFYTGLAGGRNPSDALREAKLDMIRAGGVYRKPWYWAAFQLFTTDARNGSR